MWCLMCVCVCIWHFAAVMAGAHNECDTHIHTCMFLILFRACTAHLLMMCRCSWACVCVCVMWKHNSNSGHSRHNNSKNNTLASHIRFRLVGCLFTLTDGRKSESVCTLCLDHHQFLTSLRTTLTPIDFIESLPKAKKTKHNFLFRVIFWSVFEVYSFCWCIGAVLVIV